MTPEDKIQSLEDEIFVLKRIIEARNADIRNLQKLGEIKVVDK